MFSLRAVTPELELSLKKYKPNFSLELMNSVEYEFIRRDLTMRKKGLKFVPLCDYADYWTYVEIDNFIMS